MASLQIYSTFQYDDLPSMEAFFVENALRHTQYATLIATKSTTQVPMFDVFDSRMVLDLAQMMKQPAGKRINPVSFKSWLQLHSSLHEAEIKALGVKQDFDLYDADFTTLQSMQDWLNFHASLHDYEDASLGV